MSIRLLLLIIGVFIVLAIFLWEYYSRQKKEKKHSQVLYERDLSGELDSATEEHRPDFNEIDAQESEAKINNEKDVTIDDLSISAKEIKQPVQGDEQIPLLLHDIIEPDNTPVETISETVKADQDASTTEDNIIMLVINASADHFSGLDIISACKQAGMKFGAMNIFHHFGIGDMALDKPVFSLANLYEPGEFSLQDMDDFKTRGLVMYMCLPAPFEGELALELMLNTARRVAESLNGEVCDSRRTPLSDKEISKMRTKIKNTGIMED